MIDVTLDAACTATSYATCERWAQADRIGSVVAAMDGAGAVLEKYRYSPYGVPGWEGAVGFPFRFTGQKLDPETGLYYYKARYYDPETGRFLQTDPIGYEDRMNLYAYVGNDPVNGTDPAGLAKCGDNLTGDACESALDDADAARDNARGAAGALRGIAEKKRNGEDLTQAESDAVALVQSRFGKEYGSADNLDKVAGGIDKIADRIGERGSGATLVRGGDMGDTRATIRGSWTIVLSDNWINDSSSGARQRTIVHEGAHLVGRSGDLYAGSRGRASPRFGGMNLEDAVRANDRARGRKPYDLANQADAWACSVGAYNPYCQ